MIFPGTEARLTGQEGEGEWKKGKTRGLRQRQLIRQQRNCYNYY